MFVLQCVNFLGTEDAFLQFSEFYNFESVIKLLMPKTYFKSVYGALEIAKVMYYYQVYLF